MNTDVDQISHALTEFDALSSGLAQLQKNYAGLLFEVDTAKGMEHAKAARAVLRKPRYEIERIRKGAKAPLLAIGRKLDSEAARITAEILKLEEPITQQIKNEETRKQREALALAEAEAKRVQAIQERITELRAVVEVCTRYNCTSAEIAEHTQDIERIAVDESFEEFRQQAEEAKTSTLVKLREAHGAAITREDEQRKAAEAQSELQKLRADAAARDAKERAEREERERQDRVKREAEEKAQREKLAAEQAERARLQKIEQDRIDAENKKLAEERAKFEAEQAEARRKAEAEETRKRAEAEAERKRKEEAERLAKKSKFPGDKAIVDALMDHFGVPEAVINKWLSQLKQVAA